MSHLLSLQSRRALAGVVLFVFRLDALVVRLEGIAVCGDCGVHALQVGPVYVMGSGGGAMPFQRIRVGCSGWLFCGAARVVGVPGRLSTGV